MLSKHLFKEKFEKCFTDPEVGANLRLQNPFNLAIEGLCEKILDNIDDVYRNWTSYLVTQSDWTKSQMIFLLKATG